MNFFDFVYKRVGIRAFSRRMDVNRKKLELYETLTENETDAFRYLKHNEAVVRMRYNESCQKIKKEEIRENVFVWAKEFVNNGNAYLSKDEILNAVDRFDETAMLTPAEFFALRDVIIMESAAVFEEALEKTLCIQKAMIDAENWMEKEDEFPSGFDPVFFMEHAIKLSAEKGDKQKRENIASVLKSIGKTDEEIIRIASDRVSGLLSKLTNAVLNIHGVVDIDWMEAFLRISHIEKTLMEDPSEIYPHMDEESKTAVRRQIDLIHQKTHTPQRRIASLALELAKDEENGITQILYTDEGMKKLLEKMNAPSVRVPKMAPDKNGYKIILSQIAVMFIGSLLAACAFHPACLIFLFPCLFVLSEEVVRKIASRFVHTRPLLALDSSFVEEENRTIVVIPALLTSDKSVWTALNQLESYGIHEESENIDFLLLGDFKDSQTPQQEGDEEIVKAAKKGIKELNLRSEREKYYYLHRKRTFNESDQRYMGYERKRGALIDLNRLLLGYRNRFEYESAPGSTLSNRYKYVVTVDVDTKILPGTLRKMISTLSHPLNHTYAVLQPRMETIGKEKRNLFSSWMAGYGGSDHYDVCASDFYQDLTGEGFFSGKGIYNIEAFYEKTSEAFQENTVLSHDMIEGIVSKAGYLGNVVMYESFPETTDAYYKRLDRWMRGDWQLMKYLLGRIELNAIGRWKILSNQIRSLKTASILIGIIVSVWTNQIELLSAMLFIQFLPFVFNGTGALKACIADLLLLPVTAYTVVKAASAALIRVYITHQKCLEWVTAAESERGQRRLDYPGIISAILMIPGTFSKEFILPSIALAICFAFGKSFFDMSDKIPPSDNYQTNDYAYLTDLAKRMWKYFEKYVPFSSNGFPPDNVQIDPPIGEQARTSPTNIGMYLLCVIGAREMGLIERDEMTSRIVLTLSSLKKIETWNGLPFNWYDIKTLKPAQPKYVSSVDAGNLMAAYVALRNYFQSEEENLSKEFDELIRLMRIEKLYNSQRKLFRIGVDVQNNRLSASHYDIFASEARILSYTAIAEKKIPVSHWKHLARPFFFHRGKSTLYSWSGTMFEYMMPNLLMPCAFGSLMMRSMNAAIDLQIQKSRDGIWGISEAGYAAFDQALNYQYKAFGLPRLALSGETSDTVYAPYAVLLALEQSFHKGMDALKAMQEAGLKGEFGFYEAIDYTRSEQGRIVYSYMSHHLGMSFIAVCNLLTNNAVRNCFMNHPKEQALIPLLNEKPFLMPLHQRLLSHSLSHPFKNAKAGFVQRNGYQRIASQTYAEGHILFSGSSTAYFENTGRSFLRKDGICANLFRHDSTKTDASLLPVIMADSEKVRLEKCRFDTDCAIYEYASEKCDSRVSCTLNPTNGDLILKVEVENKTDEKLPIKINHGFRLSLNTEDMNYAHPVFSDLFVRTETKEKAGFEHARRDRETGQYFQYLYHLTNEDKNHELPPPRLYGKHSIIQREIDLNPREMREVYFAVGLDKQKRDFSEKINARLFDRAKTLLMGQMNAHIQFCGLSEAEYRSADRRLSSLFSLKPKLGEERSEKHMLWPLGLSGNEGILLVKLKSHGDLTHLRKVVRMHEFYCCANLPVTLVILKIKETEYFTPLKDAAMNILLSGHLAERIGKEGGCMLFAIDDLTPDQIRVLEEICVSAELNPLSEPRILENANIESRISYEEDEMIAFNGFGGFQKETNAYQILVSQNRIPPRRWSNFIVNPCYGALVSDLGIENLYFGNSRMGRITAFENNLDASSESIRIEIQYGKQKLSVFPGKKPKGTYKVIHDTGNSVYSLKTNDMDAETIVFVHPEKPVLFVRTKILNRKDEKVTIHLNADVRFLMGTDDRELRFTKLFKEKNKTIAFGNADFFACAGFSGHQVSDDGMSAEVFLKPNEEKTASFVITASERKEDAVQWFLEVNGYEDDFAASSSWWNFRMDFIQAFTGNSPRDKLINGFLKYQTIASRYFARFGPYQPGGAYGMRDQLQDLLSIMYFDPMICRKHILLCAERQFEKGDGLHWWHMPANGVRTKISDDVLFLALVTAKYIERTGDTQILSECIPYLKEKEIPQGEHDRYDSYEKTEKTEPLDRHIMKAFHVSDKRGAHGLLLMGTGDWNDGMNRVGEGGVGESVWLSEFWIYVSEAYMPYANDADKAYLKRSSDQIRSAIEASAWDGKWYLRAFFDNGEKLGSSENEECRIDLIAQAWAVLIGLDKERGETAIKSVEEHLVDTKENIVKLLSPPFTGRGTNPGYISAYPPGIRENGGQYTHAVTWLVKAYAKTGQAEKAWKTFDMLLPINRTNEYEKARYYEGEPYVISADISNNDQNMGVCGWTWYTGAAAWTLRVFYEDLLGFRIKGNQVIMHPLLPEEQDEVQITLNYGKSSYILKAQRNTKASVQWVSLIDDGKQHTFDFPVRN